MSQFGGSSRDDDYGYFGTPKPSASASQFGSAAPAPSPFGAPASAPVTGFGFPPPPAAAPKRGAGKGGAVKLVGILAVLAVVAFGGWRVWDGVQASKPVVVPTVLGGLQESTDADILKVAADAEAAIRAQNPDTAIEAAGYGDRSQFFLLAVARGRLDIDKELQDAKMPGAPVKQGSSTCMSSPGERMIMCLRSSRTLAVEVVSYGSTVFATEAAVEEAWLRQ